MTLGLVVLVPHWRLGDSTLVGLAWGVLSGFSFACLLRSTDASAAAVGRCAGAMAQNAIAAFCLMPFVDGVMPGSATQWLWLIALGVVWTALAHTLFIACLREVPPQTAAVVAALEPVYGIALAAMLFAETARRARVDWRRADHRRHRVDDAGRRPSGRDRFCDRRMMTHLSVRPARHVRHRHPRRRHRARPSGQANSVHYGRRTSADSGLPTYRGIGGFV